MIQRLDEVTTGRMVTSITKLNMMVFSFSLNHQCLSLENAGRERGPSTYQPFPASLSHQPETVVKLAMHLPAVPRLQIFKRNKRQTNAYSTSIGAFLWLWRMLPL